MPKITFLRPLFFAVLLLIAGCSRPDFNLIDGDPVRLSDAGDQWIIINYWAEWCTPCLEEVPELNQFYKQAEGKVLFYSISFDKDTNESLAEQKKKYGMEYPVIATTPSPRINIPKPSALPANYLIAPDGTSYGPVLGPQTADSMVALFQEYQQKWMAER